jgi:N-methylhydantoinase A/oxoprolinase/acetone carboxylase beta subunit
VAGASYLAGLADAMVVDMGGTTTDTAMIRRGAVRICDRGATVGGWRTHVRALDLRTLGLGGDSLIAREKDGRLRIGPLRVAPVAWLFDGADSTPALDWLARRLDRFRDTTRGMDLVGLTGSAERGSPAPDEVRVLDALAAGPMSVDELSCRLGGRHWQFLPLDRLEREHRIQRSALTPTDVLHATGQVELWNAEAARRTLGLFARLVGLPAEELARRVVEQIVRQLAVELLKKQLADEADAESLEESPAAAAMIGNWLAGGADGYRVRVAVRHPVVGIGAPVHLFLPQAATLLETEAVIPPHADVANAIGAITSAVSIQKQVELAPGDGGRYYLSGLAGAPSFADFHEAQAFALEELQRLVRRQAREAGTSQSRVEIAVHDHLAPSAFGDTVFLGRTFTARLTGQPDLAVLGNGEGIHTKAPRQETEVEGRVR